MNYKYNIGNTVSFFDVPDSYGIIKRQDYYVEENSSAIKPYYLVEFDKYDWFWCDEEDLELKYLIIETWMDILNEV